MWIAVQHKVLVCTNLLKIICKTSCYKFCILLRSFVKQVFSIYVIYFCLAWCNPLPVGYECLDSYKAECPNQVLEVLSSVHIKDIKLPYLALCDKRANYLPLLLHSVLVVYGFCLSWNASYHAVETRYTMYAIKINQ